MCLFCHHEADASLELIKKMVRKGFNNLIPLVLTMVDDLVNIRLKHKDTMNDVQITLEITEINNDKTLIEVVDEFNNEFFRLYDEAISYADDCVYEVLSKMEFINFTRECDRIKLFYRITI